MSETQFLIVQYIGRKQRKTRLGYESHRQGWEREYEKNKVILDFPGFAKVQKCHFIDFFIAMKVFCIGK